VDGKHRLRDHSITTWARRSAGRPKLGVTALACPDLRAAAIRCDGIPGFGRRTSAVRVAPRPSLRGDRWGRREGGPVAGGRIQSARTRTSGKSGAAHE
jgi:hypothetical protein